MYFGDETPEEDAFSILDAYVEAGGNFVDTAASSRQSECAYFGRLSICDFWCFSKGTLDQGRVSCAETTLFGRVKPTTGWLDFV
jgi:hypothetical protein